MPPRYPDELRQAVVAAVSKGLTIREIAEQYGVSVPWVRSCCKEVCQKKPKPRKHPCKGCYMLRSAGHGRYSTLCLFTCLRGKEHYKKACRKAGRWIE